MLQKKRVMGRRWFYVFVGLVNLAVGDMFYVFNVQEVPPLASYSMPALARPKLSSPETVPAVKGTPTRIVVASLAIDLSVRVGSYDLATNNWTTGPTSAYFADSSLPVNDSNGRTLIYGHAQSQVFGRLPEITPDTEALVYTDNGYVFHYRYKSTHDVVPSDTSVFTEDGPPTLVLQTCTGNWDAYRALFSFKFESEEKA